MLNIATKFASTLLASMLVIGVLGGLPVGTVAFFYWLSGGAIWGLLAALLIAPSLVIAAVSCWLEYNQ